MGRRVKLCPVFSFPLLIFGVKLLVISKNEVNEAEVQVEEG